MKLAISLALVCGLYVAGLRTWHITNLIGWLMATGGAHAPHHKLVSALHNVTNDVDMVQLAASPPHHPTAHLNS